MAESRSVNPTPLGVCTECKKGIIRPLGGKRYVEQSSPKGGYRKESEYADYQCDKCGHQYRFLVVSDYAEATDTVKVHK